VLVVRRPAFVGDLTDAYAYLVERNPQAADQLLDEVEVTVELLAAFPLMGRQRSELREGVRSLRLRRFPYILFYKVRDEALTLLRLLHGARDQHSQVG
jgi:toxin ParE1/3/4